MTAPEGAALPLADVRVPVDVLDVEVGELASGPQEPVPHDALVLARERGVPVATFLVAAGSLPGEWLPLVAEHRVRTAPPGRPGAVAQVRAAVVVTTIAVSEELAETLGCVLAQTLPPAEVVVVDNRPRTSGVREWLAGRFTDRVRYVPAPLPGLARARNAGLLAIGSEFVAFTDDDVRLDPTWLERLMSAFEDEIACVTGLLMPTGLHTEAQLLMERFGGFSKGLVPRRYDLRVHRDDGPLFPYSVGVYGSGANAAFRTSALRAIGGFDPALGTGRVTRGGEDLDIFLRVVLSGRTLAYEPAAVAWHHHEAELEQFRNRVYGYGVGLGAVLAKHALSSPRSGREMLSRLPAAVRHLRDPSSPKNLQKCQAYPAAYTWLERAGIAIGPFAYARARWQSRLTDEPVQPLADRSGPLPAWPRWCTELELSAALPAGVDAPAGRGYTTARVLVRLHGQPLGYVTVPLVDGGFRTADVVAGLDDAARAQLSGHLSAERLSAGSGLSGGSSGHGLAGLPEATDRCPVRVETGPSVTVAVCTRDRGPDLAACLRRLVVIDYPDVEFLVVDNAPRDDATKAVFDATVGTDDRFRYLVEPRPGLSRARNAALANAGGEVIAFTDDDVEVDVRWVHGLVHGFARGPKVACVTGLVCTAGVHGPAEAYFDGRVSWGDSCEPRVFGLARNAGDPLFPYSPGIFGTGASFAVRTDLMRRLGGFDEALGAGTPTGGGEDLDAFVRIVLSGAELAYEPAAVVWHHHRAELSDLRRQMVAYGSGLTAFLAKHLADPATRAGVLRRVPVGVRRLTAVPGETQAELDGVPVSRRSLMAAELRGMVAGPILYRRARRSLAEIT